MCVEVLHIIFLALVFPKKDLSKAVISEVIVIRREQTAKLRMLKLNYAPASEVLAVILIELAEGYSLEP